MAIWPAAAKGNHTSFPSISPSRQEWPTVSRCQDGKSNGCAGVVNGRFQELPEDDAWHEERLHAWSLLEKHLNWWGIGSLKPEDIRPAQASTHVFYDIYLNDVSCIRLALSALS